MKRAGFSLLEILVALALSVILLGAIYAALDLFWRYSTTGQEEIERAQLARAILRTIEMDLRSVVYKSATEGSSSGGGASGSAGTAMGGSTGGGSTGGGATGGGATGGGATGGGATGGGSQQSSTSGLQSSGSSQGGAAGSSGSTGSIGSSVTTAAQPAGLVGDASTLLITVSSPSRRFDYAPIGTGGGARTSDLLSVSYQMAPLQTASAASAGLARMEGDRLLLSQADTQGNEQLLAANTKILASEVTALRFAFFDGYSWRATWDSSQLSGLPMAVEVEIEVTTPPRGSRPGAPAAARQSKSQSFRLVVAIPLAKAIDTSMIQ